MSIRQKLIARGYWAEAASDGSQAGGAEGAAETNTDAATDTGEGAEGGDKGGEGEATDTGEGETTDDQPEGAPEQYEDFTLPDGFEGEVSFDGFKEAAKELNLTQEQAQKLADLHTGAIQQMQEQAAERVAQWAEDAKADKEIGGEKFDTSLQSAKNALTRFGNDGLTQFLEETGLGNHPEMIRAFAKIDAAISEDQLDDSGGQGGQRSVADKLYPSMRKE